MGQLDGRPVAAKEITRWVRDLASGEPTGNRTPATSERLTALELQIARLAAQNRVGRLSHRTVSTRRATARSAHSASPRAAGSETCSHDA
ncbi:hypothetical protein AB0F17_57340 [Nonomuraea sp. NPDC026600]|uniref:hypothetical protein n=1 Tax=Nonomuraea sp. NPDC026600 TaxID=3155363 RepID=UPI0033FCC847